MRDFELERELERARNLISHSGRLIIINSDRYSTHLQRTVEEASFFDGPSVLVAAAEQVAAEQLEHFFSGRSDLKGPEARLKSAAALFQAFGFGELDFGRAGSNGGKVTVKNSYFAKHWQNRFGRRNTPGCFFTAGYIAGAMSAAYSRSAGDFIAKERRCLNTGARHCEFEVEVK